MSIILTIIGAFGMMIVLCLIVQAKIHFSGFLAIVTDSWLGKYTFIFTSFPLIKKIKIRWKFKWFQVFKKITCMNQGKWNIIDKKNVENETSSFCLCLLYFLDKCLQWNQWLQLTPIWELGNIWWINVSDKEAMKKVSTCSKAIRNCWTVSKNIEVFYPWSKVRWDERRRSSFLF